MLGILSASECSELLGSNLVGRIGCTDGKRVYVVPVNYVFDGTAIICHSKEGLKIKLMQSNPEVCFEVDEMKDLCNWKSVIAYGRYREITDELERYQAMRLMVERTFSLKLSQTAHPPHLSADRVHTHEPGSIKVIVFRIEVTELTGRFEQS